MAKALEKGYQADTAVVKTIVETILQIMEKRSLTGCQLARDSKIPQARISRTLSLDGDNGVVNSVVDGHIKAAAQKTLIEICDHLGLNFQEIYGTAAGVLVTRKAENDEKNGEIVKVLMGGNPELMRLLALGATEVARSNIAHLFGTQAEPPEQAIEHIAAGLLKTLEEKLKASKNRGETFQSILRL